MQSDRNLHWSLISEGTLAHLNLKGLCYFNKQLSDFSFIKTWFFVSVSVWDIKNIRTIHREKLRKYLFANITNCLHGC